MSRQANRQGALSAFGMWAGIGGAVSALAAATIAGLLGGRWLSLPDVALLYLCAVLFSAVSFGRIVGLATSALAVLAYNFFFVPPFHTLRIHSPHHLLTFAVLFLSGLLASALVDRLRTHERQAREASLRAQHEELRSSLLSSVSHDLRTPLAVITTAATALRESSRELDVDQRRDMLDTICSESLRMERLVSNLLDMMKLDSGGLVPACEWVTVEELLSGALNRLENRLDGRQIRVELPEELPLLSVDPILIEQALWNVLDNALKYTPVDTAIMLEISSTARELLIQIRDHGPGLPLDGPERVMDKFWRASTASGGTGLGLAICKGILLAHGGRLEAANHPAGGAQFTLVLPLPTDQPPRLDVDWNEGAEA